MTAPNTRPVIAAVDGSPTSLDALRWALDEARRRHLPVLAVLALPLSWAPAPLIAMAGPGPALVDDGIPAEVLQEARRMAPDVPTKVETRVGSPGSVLVAASREAALVVVGRSHHRALGEAVAGSTSAQVVGHAACPVVVVESAVFDGVAETVVVGVDASPHSQGALDVAYEEAELRHLPLVAVHAWPVDVPRRPSFESLADALRSESGQHAERVLSEALAGWAEERPDVELRRVVVPEPPVEALIAQAQRAALIVVGSRGHGGFAGLALGSVSQGLLHHRRPCPLMVVHRPQ